MVAQAVPGLNYLHVRILESTEMTSLDPARGTVSIGGKSLAFGRAILAAGYRSFPLLESLTSGLQKPLGQAVKGQAALLVADVDPGLPTIFRDGLYVVAHASGWRHDAPQALRSEGLSSFLFRSRPLYSRHQE